MKKKVLNCVRNYFPLILFFMQALLLNRLLIAPGTFDYVWLFNTCISLAALSVLVILPIGYIAALITQSVLLFGFYYANAFLIESRMRPLNFIDFFCISDAVNVNGSYSVVFNKDIAYSLMLTILITAVNCGAVILFYKKPKTIRKFLKPLAGVVAVVTAFGTMNYCEKNHKVIIELLSWDEDRYVKNNGIFFSLYSEYKNSKIVVPEGYSKDKAISMLEKYPVVEGKGETPTNIIVIMNEAFADFTLVGEPQFDDPLIALHNYLKKNKNIKEGKLAVNISGGGTCNSEFEFLTGCSLAFLPVGDIPYIRHDMSGLNSMGNDIEKFGYSSVPIHPYIAAEWRRTTIYPKWFTEKFISGENFTGDWKSADYSDVFGQDRSINFGDDLEYIRNYISDKESFKKDYEVMQEMNDEGKKSFIFNITMQNHGGYGPDINRNLDIIDYTGSIVFNLYLSLSKHTSESYVEFMEKLEDYPEPTVVLMFGDHQPGLTVEEVDSYKTDDDLATCANKYTVPYLLWSNCDIDWDIPDYLSINYLSAVLKKNCNLELTEFDTMRLAAMEEYPILTKFFCMDKDGKYVTTDEAMKSDIVREYENIQYYKMFSK